MIDRVVMAIGLIVLGVMAYRLMLLAQQRIAANGSQFGAGTGRSALLVFTSPTCGPCKLQQMPIVNHLMLEWRDTIDLRVIDVTEQPEVASQYGVWSLPTTIVLDARRNVVAINQGVAHERKLREQFAVSTNQRVGESMNRPVPN